MPNPIPRHRLLLAVLLALAAGCRSTGEPRPGQPSSQPSNRTGDHAAVPPDSTPERGRHYFYRPRRIGSEALFNPIASFLAYTLDSLPIEQFGTSHFGTHLDTVIDHLGDPVNTIRENGGTREFINTEVFPIDFDNLSDSQAALPNYALHLFGGGLIYRKNAEWIEAHDVPFPYLTSGVLSMITEVMQEAIEKPETDATDEIADLLLFRPVGILLFSSDDCAHWIQENFHPVDWPYMIAWDTDDNRVVNVGLNYVVRPDWLWDADTRIFAHLGITNVFGLAHRITERDSISWGVGASTETVQPTQLHASAGLFWDRDDSLLASVIVNGTEDFVVRTNIYPGVLLPNHYPLGLFISARRDGGVTAGVQWGLPIAIAR